MNKCLKVLWVVLIINCSFLYTTEIKVGVVIFRIVGSDLDPKIAENVCDYFLEEFSKINGWEIVGKEKLAKTSEDTLKKLLIGNELKSPLDQGQRIVVKKIRKTTGVKKLIFGNIWKVDRDYHLQVKILDTKNYKIESIKKVICKCGLQKISNCVESLVLQVVGRIEESPKVIECTPDRSNMVIIETGPYKIGLSEIGYKILSSLNPYLTRDNFSPSMPQTEIYINEFYIDKLEVTNRKYKEFCDSTGHPYPPSPGWGGKYANYFSEFPDYPVVNVSWYDADKYCRWKGKRLPTEFEWEKAAKGKDDRIWPWGNEYKIGKANTQKENNYITKPAKVGIFADDQSPYGVLDLIGNVSEWCDNWFFIANYRDNIYKNPAGPKIGTDKSFRGGNWSSLIQNSIISKRMWLPPDQISSKIGFRCACCLKKEEK